MSENTFKIGDKVKHKSTEDFSMVIIKNSIVTYEERTKELKHGSKSPDKFICKYYNKYTKEWEENEFHYTELEKQ